jgi:hypothetical protein
VSRTTDWDFQFCEWDMARARMNPDDYEDTPRAIVAIGNEYPPSFELDWHSHRRGQLLYAANGVIVLSTPQGAWIAPPERAVWTRRASKGAGHSTQRALPGDTFTRATLSPVSGKACR